MGVGAIGCNTPPIFLQEIITIGIMSNFQHYADQVPDSLKLATAVSAPVLTFLGIAVEQWTFVLSAVVSLFFIIEKFPTIVKRIVEFITWMKNVKKRKQ